MRGGRVGLAGMVAAGRAWTDPPPDVRAAIDTLKKVGPAGAGIAGSRQLLPSLAPPMSASCGSAGGFDDANPLAANWIRSAIESIAERQTRTGAAAGKTHREFSANAARPAARPGLTNCCWPPIPQPPTAGSRNCSTTRASSWT